MRVEDDGVEGESGEGVCAHCMCVNEEECGCLTLNLDPRKIYSTRNKFFKLTVKYLDLP